MADSLKRQKLCSEPLMLNNNSCGWCPYGSVCLSQKDDRLVVGFRSKNEEVIDSMKNKAGEKYVPKWTDSQQDAIVMPPEKSWCLFLPRQAQVKQRFLFSVL